MASGATITVTGGTDMQYVLPGDTIEPADFNNARSNLDDILSAPTSVSDLHGLNQGGISVGQAVAGTTIEALSSSGAFGELQNEMQSMNAFYGATTNVYIQADVIAGDIIESDTWNGLMSDVKQRWDSPVKDISYGSKSYPVSDTWIVDVDGAWTGTLTSTVTFTWSSSAELNAFFNGGGAVGVEGAIVDYTGSDSQTLSWKNKLDTLGDVVLAKQSTSAGAGTNAGLGQIDMTTSYQSLNTYAGNITYANDFANVSAQVNNTTSPTSVTVQMTLKDGDDVTSFQGYVSSVDEPVLGDTRIRGVLITPQVGVSGYTFSSPSVTQTNIVET